MNNMTRREAIVLSGATLLVSQIGGCAQIAQVGRVVINIPWTKVARIVGAVVSVAAKLLELTAILDGDEEQSMAAQLTDSQTTALQSGGQLLIRAADGQEFEVPIEVAK